MSPHCEIFSNGLRIVLVPCEAESVAFGLFVASGSRHEDAKNAGISHFIEHMLFKGTPTRSPLDITRAIEGRGGNFNACTDEEMTCFFTHLPNEYLSDAVAILSDMYLNASLPEDEFLREKQVVIEEIRMYRDEPDSVAMENLQASLFTGDQLGQPISGTPESLAPMTPAQLRKYISTHYLPRNTVAVVAGAFDCDEALKLICDALGKCRRQSDFDPLLVKVGHGTTITPQVSASRPGISQAQIALGFRTFGLGDERKYALTVLDAVLGRGMSSRLFQQVREKRGLSYDISSRMQFFRDAGMFTITAGVDVRRVDATLKTIDRELRRIREKRVGAAELNRTKEFLLGNFRLAHEKITAKMFFYGQTMLAYGRLMLPAEQIEGVRQVTSEQLREVAAEVLSETNRALSTVLPAT